MPVRIGAIGISDHKINRGVLDFQVIDNLEGQGLVGVLNMDACTVASEGLPETDGFLPGESRDRDPIGLEGSVGKLPARGGIQVHGELVQGDYILVGNDDLARDVNDDTAEGVKGILPHKFMGIKGDVLVHVTGNRLPLDVAHEADHTIIERERGEDQTFEEVTGLEVPCKLTPVHVEPDAETE